MPFSVRLNLLGVLLLTTGCATADLIGARGADGFTSAAYPLHIDGKPAAFDSQHWMLENVRPAGKPGELVSKLGKQYERTVKFDGDGDGSYETARRMWNDELSFRHRRTNALLSVSVLPLDQTMTDTDMAVLVRDYVDAVSGGGTVSVNIGPGTTAAAERRFATRILDSAVFTVDGEPAAGATFEVANVDQLELSKDARWERARVVLIRAPWRLVADQQSSAWPTLIRVLYSSRSESFEAHAGDFVDLVKAIDFEGHRQAIEAKARAIRACLEDPRDRLQLVLSLDAEGRVGGVRLLRRDDQGRQVVGSFLEDGCIENAFVATKLPQVPAPFDVAWPLDPEGKVISSVGVPDGTADFSVGSWPPRTTGPADERPGGENATSEAPLPSVTAAPSAIPAQAAPEIAPMPDSQRGSSP